MRQIADASTPHFALQSRNRLRALVARLDADDPVRAVAEEEISRLEELAVTGQTRGLAEEYGDALPRLATG